MILTDREIRNLSIKSNLIVPFKESSLQSESYDLSIGTEIAALKKEVSCVSILDQESIDSMYEDVNISNGYIISPHEYILVKVNEAITLPDNITAHIRPRTRFTRLGLIVSDQHCNSTYSGNLRVGLYNATEFAIKIIPGIQIAQIVFEELKSVPSEKKQYKNKQNAAYQNEKSFVGAKFSEEVEEEAKRILKELSEK